MTADCWRGAGVVQTDVHGLRLRNRWFTPRVLHGLEVDEPALQR